MNEDRVWRRCSACKSPIELGTTYQVCSVSTCNRGRTGLVFCSVDCWEVHLPEARHREAWAVERIARADRDEEEARRGKSSAGTPRSERPTRRIVPSPPAAPSRVGSNAPTEVLIVASRLKEYVRARSGFNTSDRVLDPLSDIVRRVCDEAIQNAARDGRRTVLDRDIPRG